MKVGVIGIGHLGRYHTLKYAQIPEVDLVGVTDVDKKRAHEVASECWCKPFDNIDSLLDNVEAVSIAVPTDHHFKVAQQALRRGKHCLIEKPITSTVEEADTLIQLAKEKNAVLHVGHIERFNPAMQALNNFPLQPQFIESHRLAPFDPRGTEVAVVLDLMIHDIDVILNMVQYPVVSIDAKGVSVVSNSVDIASARIQFKNNCVANLTASRISQKKMRKMRLFQKDTYISVDFLNKLTEIYQLEKIPAGLQVVNEIGVGDKKRQISYQCPEIPREDGLHSEIIAFFHAVQGKPSSGVTGEEGREALSVALQIVQHTED